MGVPRFPTEISRSQVAYLGTRVRTRRDGEIRVFLACGILRRRSDGSIVEEIEVSPVQTRLCQRKLMAYSECDSRLVLLMADQI
ncbi:hypothetical protein KIPB_012958, partial [Kipferlia bialata]|eukprot:g12958.t1